MNYIYIFNKAPHVGARVTIGGEDFLVLRVDRLREKFEAIMRKA
jgi:hypothetical protein